MKKPHLFSFRQMKMPEKTDFAVLDSKNMKKNIFSLATNGK